MDTSESHPDQLAASEAAQADDPAAKTRQWLLETHDATLCTTSTKRGLEGYPFGSVVPFALAADGTPLILIARIAAHTANLRADPRASLFVRQPNTEGDPQSGWRVTVMGAFEQVSADDPEFEDLHARYTERVPSAADYHKTHDFSYWRMPKIEKVRYIAGFGKITWIDGAKLHQDPLGAGLRDSAPGAIAHMNEDHAENLKEMCRGWYGLEPEAARMHSLDRTGFTIETDGPRHLLYFPFGRQIGADGVRGAVIDVLRRARERAGAR